MTETDHEAETKYEREHAGLDGLELVDRSVQSVSERPSSSVRPQDIGLARVVVVVRGVRMDGRLSARVRVGLQRTRLREGISRKARVTSGLPGTDLSVVGVRELLDGDHVDEIQRDLARSVLALSDRVSKRDGGCGRDG